MKTKVKHVKHNQHDVYIGRRRASVRPIPDPQPDIDLVKLGQSGYFCNPFKLNGQPAGSTLQEFKKYFYERLRNDEVFRHQINRLRGKTLGCFCSPDTCHGFIISSYLNK